MNCAGVSVTSLSVVYRQGIRSRPFTALSEISFSIDSGGSFGLVGESGAGKSTLIRSIAGYLRPASGSILCGGVDLEGDLDSWPVRRRAWRRERSQRQIVPQDPGGTLNPRLRIGTSIAEACLARDTLAGNVEASVRPIRIRNRYHDEVAELLERVGLERHDADRIPTQFSGGQRQRICIARALACSPKLLLLDEPTAGLDAGVAAKIVKLLIDVKDEFGITVIVVSHDLSVVADLCDSVGVLKDGRLVETGDRRTLFAGPQHAYTRALVESMPRIRHLPDGHVWNAWSGNTNASERQ